MLRKYATTEILSATMAPTGAAALARYAHRHQFAYEPRPGYLYVRSRAISSRTNDNFDTFPPEEIEKSYASFVGKPVFVNHNNDNHHRARGVVIDAALHKDSNHDGSPDTWVEVLMEVDAVRFPKLAKAIVEGHIDRTSMGTDVAFSKCSFCGNKATTPLEYCTHIPKMKGQRIYRTTASGTKEGVLVSEICHGLKFFENSLLVEEPADPTAYFLGVEGHGAKTASKKVAHQYADEWPDAVNMGGHHFHEAKRLPAGKPVNPRPIRPRTADKTVTPHSNCPNCYSTDSTPGRANGVPNGLSTCKDCGTNYVRHDSPLPLTRPFDINDDPAAHPDRDPRNNTSGTTDPFGRGNRNEPGTLMPYDPTQDKRLRPSLNARAVYGGDLSPVLAYGEQMAPADVDTLRDEECPVCGEADAFDGNECDVCGFIAPPKMFMDPDLDAAKQMDLRGDMQQQMQSDPNGDGMPDVIPGSGNPGMDAPPMDPEQVPDPNDVAQQQVNEIMDDQDPLQPEELDENGQPVVDQNPLSQEQPQDPNATQMAPEDVAGQGAPGTPGDGVPDLMCPVCGFSTDASQPTSVDMDTPTSPLGEIAEGALCPQCGQSPLVSAKQVQEQVNQQTALPMQASLFPVITLAGRLPHPEWPSDPEDERYTGHWGYEPSLDPRVCNEHGRKNCGPCNIGTAENFEANGANDPHHPKCDTHGVRNCVACGY